MCTGIPRLMCFLWQPKNHIRRNSRYANLFLHFTNIHFSQNSKLNSYAKIQKVKCSVVVMKNEAILHGSLMGAWFFVNNFFNIVLCRLSNRHDTTRHKMTQHNMTQNDTTQHKKTQKFEKSNLASRVCIESS